MTANDVREHLKTLDGGWVDWDNTVDTIKIGDPNVELTGIAVGWMSYTESLRRAHDLGCNLFVCHEPTFYNHLDKDQKIFGHPGVQAKKDMLDEMGMVVMRCHDLWDQLLDIGIPDSWGQFLGLGEAIDGSGYYRAYDVTGETALSLARKVAGQTKRLGQDVVHLLGDGAAPVTRAVIGTGAITPYQHFIEEYGADVAICSDDGFTYWRDGAMAIDLGVPAIVVNHAVSEIYGLQLLAEHLDGALPDVPVHFIEQKCMFQAVTA
ncbi:MAG: Nif3-like dinuclear metal center hexameric protein [Candidatus Poribacteria bacterium]